MSEAIQSEQPPCPGEAWTEIVRRPTLEEFSRAFALDVVLEASVLSRPIVGPMGLWEFFQATRTMYDRIGFTHEIGTKARTCLEWEGVFAGKPVAGVTIITRDGRGAITSVRLHHRPFDQVVAFAETVSRNQHRRRRAMPNVNLSETAPTQFQDIGDVSLAYRHFGKEGAPPVVCFQHFTGTMNNFDPVHTNRLAQDRPVILVDYRGVGRSGGKMPDSMPAIAADLIAFVKALGLKEIDLFAFSIGGMIAQQFVLDAPGLVRRILLVGTGPSGGEGMQEFSREVMDIVNRPNSTIQGRTLDLFFSKSPASYAAGKAWLERIAARKVDREPETGSEVAKAQLVALAKWGVIPATDRYGDLKKIKQRTLVVNGKNDMMVPTINSYILQQHLPDARLILYPDSGHGSHFQFPEQFAEEAARFLAAA